jgi:hypothetical protein
MLCAVCPMPGNAIAAGTRIDAFSACAKRRRVELTAAAGAAVGDAGREQICEGGFVQCTALSLPNNRAIPGKSVALQRGENRVLRTGPRAWQIDILDPNEPLAARDPRVAITRERRNERSEVQRAGR